MVIVVDHLRADSVQSISTRRQAAKRVLQLSVDYKVITLCTARKL